MSLPVFLGIAAALMLLSVIYHERKASTYHLGLVSFLFLLGIAAIVSASLWTSFGLALLVFNMIGISSRIKYNLLGFNLIANDFRNLARVTARTLWSDFRLQTLFAAGLIVLMLLVIIGTSPLLEADPVAFTHRILFAVATTSLYFAVILLSGGRRRFRTQMLIQNRAHVSAFLASCLGVGPDGRVRFSHLADQPLPLAQPLPARSGTAQQPHIILILHESTYDPRWHGTPLPEELIDVFEPENGLSGGMTVDVFGGSTWQTEFAIYCGLSSNVFGQNARFVFQMLAGHMNHALPRSLAEQGYRTVLVSSDESPLASHEVFYRSIGFQDLVYPVDGLAPEDKPQWLRERSDEWTYRYGLCQFEKHQQAGTPLFLSIMTYMNHGSHRKPRFADHVQADIRSAAMASTGNPLYAEYLVRLAESRRSLDMLRNALGQRQDGKPVLIIRYGDHQPSFAATMLNIAPTDPKLLRTFYAIEGIGLDLERPAATPEPIHSAFLSVLARAAAGLPLDEIEATRLQLMSPIYSPSSETLQRFHRSLLDQNAIVLP